MICAEGYISDPVEAIFNAPILLDTRQKLICIQDDEQETPLWNSKKLAVSWAFSFWHFLVSRLRRRWANYTVTGLA